MTDTPIERDLFAVSGVTTFDLMQLFSSFSPDSAKVITDKIQQAAANGCFEFNYAGDWLAARIHAIVVQALDLKRDLKAVLVDLTNPPADYEITLERNDFTVHPVPRPLVYSREHIEDVDSFLADEAFRRGYLSVLVKDALSRVPNRVTVPHPHLKNTLLVQASFERSVEINAWILTVAVLTGNKRSR
mgnify:CR=1 FL=1